MTEKNHYQGDFVFRFNQTHQKRLSKYLIKELFPNNIIKAAKGKTLDSYPEERIRKAAKGLHEALISHRLPYLRATVEERASSDHDETILILLIINDAIKSICSHEYFNIKNDFSQLIIKESIKKYFSTDD